MMNLIYPNQHQILMTYHSIAKGNVETLETNPNWEKHFGIKTSHEECYQICQFKSILKLKSDYWQCIS